MAILLPFYHSIISHMWYFVISHLQFLIRCVYVIQKHYIILFVNKKVITHYGTSMVWLERNQENRITKNLQKKLSNQRKRYHAFAFCIDQLKSITLRTFSMFQCKIMIPSSELSSSELSSSELSSSESSSSSCLPKWKTKCLDIWGKLSK